MDELTSLPATRLAALIKSRAVSPVEVLEAHLRRVEELNPALNAVVAFAPDAYERAREAEAALMRAGERLGPLHGVPLTIKDTIDVAGLPTTSGSRARARLAPPDVDAPAVKLLRDAGAIIMAKTNVSEMALEYTADNPLFGRTNNPYNPQRTPGGSSGGCAAAVSACLTPLSLGSDMTGSVRVPAHFCGIAGLRPTGGRVPREGHIPTITGTYSHGGGMGPLARSVDDLALCYNVIAGGRPDERLKKRLASGDDGRASLRGLCVAWYTDDGNAPINEETRAAVEAAAGALREAGFSTVEELPPGIARGPALWPELFLRESYDVLCQTYAGHADEAGPLVRVMLERAAMSQTPAHEERERAWEERERLRAALVEWMKEAPLIVAPVGSVPAFKHGARKVIVQGEDVSIFRAFGYAQTFNVYDLPVVCVPAGRTREGLPVGVQIVGRPFDEATVLTAARIIEDALGGWLPPPALSRGGHNPL